jgi:DNA-binding NarL/FixJ family response regulator
VNYKPKANNSDQHDAAAFDSAATPGQTPAVRPNPTFNLEESIVLRAFAAGKSDKEICQEFRMVPMAVYEVMRDLEQKTGTRDRAGLLVWVLRQRQDIDSRKDERNYAWRRSTA